MNDVLDTRVSSSSNLGTIQILVVDDESSIRALLRAVLETDGYHVAEASNGRVALEMYQQRSPDLVITDLAMPEMDGLCLIIELKLRSEDVKVIAMTGGPNGSGRLAAAKMLGARNTLEKPFSLDALRSVVRSVLAS